MVAGDVVINKLHHRAIPRDQHILVALIIDARDLHKLTVTHQISDMGKQLGRRGLLALGGRAMQLHATTITR